MTGDINVFLSVLGCSEGDSDILNAIVKLGMDFAIEKFSFDDIEQTYYHFHKSGGRFYL